MAEIFVGSWPGAGKTTAFTGSVRFKVKGLVPENTLVITSGAKVLSVAHYRKYKTITYGEDLFSVLKTASPIEANYVALSTANAFNPIHIINYIKKAMKFGIKRNGKVYPLQNVIFDDFQAFLNDGFYGTTDNVFDSLKATNYQAIKLMASVSLLNAKQENDKDFPKKRVDFFYFVHMKQADLEKSVSKSNPVIVHSAGRTLKDKYELSGKVNTFLFLDSKHNFKHKPSAGYEFVRVEEGLLPENFKGELPADLGTLKQYYNEAYGVATPQK